MEAMRLQEIQDQKEKNHSTAETDKQDEWTARQDEVQ